MLGTTLSTLSADWKPRRIASNRLLNTMLDLMQDHVWHHQSQSCRWLPHQLLQSHENTEQRRFPMPKPKRLQSNFIIKYLKRSFTSYRQKLLRLNRQTLTSPALASPERDPQPPPLLLLHAITTGRSSKTNKVRNVVNDYIVETSEAPKCISHLTHTELVGT